MTIATDGAQMGEGYVELGAELMECLRGWAAKRHLEGLLPEVIVLAGALGQPGLNIACRFHQAGLFQGRAEVATARRCPHCGLASVRLTLQPHLDRAMEHIWSCVTCHCCWELAGELRERGKHCPGGREALI